MEREIEITERMREAIIEAVKNEMRLGWSLDQLIPLLTNAVDDAIEELEQEGEHGLCFKNG